MRTFDRSDVERLGTTLDAVTLDDQDRATLHAIFALAGRAVGGNATDEVSGFGIMPPDMPAGGNSGIIIQGSVGMGDGSCFQSFQWGASGTPGGFDIF